jgi:hypothetical protein
MLKVDQESERNVHQTWLRIWVLVLHVAVLLSFCFLESKQYVSTGEALKRDTIVSTSFSIQEKGQLETEQWLFMV